jgi:hypothetical protein
LEPAAAALVGRDPGRYSCGVCVVVVARCGHRGVGWGQGHKPSSSTFVFFLFGRHAAAATCAAAAVENRQSLVLNQSTVRRQSAVGSGNWSTAICNPSSVFQRLIFYLSTRLHSLQYSQSLFTV